MSSISLSHSLSLLHVLELEPETTNLQKEDLQRAIPPLIAAGRSSIGEKISGLVQQNTQSHSQPEPLVQALRSQTQHFGRSNQEGETSDAFHLEPHATCRLEGSAKAHQHRAFWPKTRRPSQLDGIDEGPSEPAQPEASNTLSSANGIEDEATTSPEGPDVEAAVEESEEQHQTRGCQNSRRSCTGSSERQAQGVEAQYSDSGRLKATHEEAVAPAESEEACRLDGRQRQAVSRGNSDDSTITMTTVRRVKSMSSSLVPLKSALVPPTRRRSPSEEGYFQQRGTRKCARFLIGPDDSELSLKRANTAPAAVSFCDSDTWLPPPLISSPNDFDDTPDHGHNSSDEADDEDDDATPFDVNSYMARTWSLATTAKLTDSSVSSDTECLSNRYSNVIEPVPGRSNSPSNQNMTSPEAVDKRRRNQNGVCKSRSPGHEVSGSCHSASNTNVVNLSNISTVSNTESTRRFSDPHLHFLSDINSITNASPSTLLQPPEAPRAASMSEYTRRKGRMKPRGPPLVCSKARAVDPAVTACSVVASEPLRPNSVYNHPGAKYKQRTPEQRPAQTAQIVRSSTSTMQIVWSEPERHGSECSDVSVVDEDNRSVGIAYPNTVPPESNGAVTPMTKVKSKLAAWSWAKQNQSVDGDGYPKWLPLLSWHGGRASSRNASPGRSPMDRPPTPDAATPPPPPPNTRGPSGASSMRPSGAQTPMTLHTASSSSDDESEPVELRVRKRLSLIALDTAPARAQLAVPLIRSKTSPNSPLLRTNQPEHAAPPRPVSAIAAEHLPFHNHRDSFDLSRRRLEDLKQQEFDAQRSLARTRDSIAVARTRLQDASARSHQTVSPPMPIPTIPARRRPEVVAHWPTVRAGHLMQSDTRSPWQRTSLACLSPIADSSPPDDSLASSLVERLKKVARGNDDSSGGTSQAAMERRDSELSEHLGCPICETDRPRWFEAYKQGLAVDV